MWFCEACSVSVPRNPGALKQHLEGKRHAAMRFYGDPTAAVRRIELRNPGPSQSLELALRPHEVSDAAAAATCEARALVRKRLVVHTGVAYQNQAWALLTPEALCGGVLQLEAAISARALPCVECLDRAQCACDTFEAHCARLLSGGAPASPLFLLALAQRLGGGGGGGRGGGGGDRGGGGGGRPSVRPARPSSSAGPSLAARVAALPHCSRETSGGAGERLVVAVAARSGVLAEMVLVTALDALCAALPRAAHSVPLRRPSAASLGGGGGVPPPGGRLDLTLRLGGAVCSRRHAAQLLKTLGGALRAASTPLGVRRVRLEVRGDAWREEDGRALAAAAAAHWWATARSVLLGTHERVGAASPLRRLPLALVRSILEAARPQCEVAAELVAEAGPAPSEPRAGAGGADLDFVASLVG